jgi:XTP/dITP diphosphohydrolase
MTDFPSVVLSSRNRKKIGEVMELLAPWKIQVQGVQEFDGVEDVEETGTTFAENADLKAITVARKLGRWTIAEDSGLCVVALGNAPGVYSARYGGEPSSDARNNAKLLAELARLQDPDRRAFYVCHAVLSDPEGRIRVRTEGRCHGEILAEYHGNHGFGYDPLFLVPEYHQTFGQLAPAVKRHISHRARAFEQFIPQMVSVFRSL